MSQLCICITAATASVLVQGLAGARLRAGGPREGGEGGARPHATGGTPKGERATGCVRHWLVLGLRAGASSVVMFGPWGKVLNRCRRRCIQGRALTVLDLSIGPGGVHVHPGRAEPLPGPEAQPREAQGSAPRLLDGHATQRRRPGCGGESLISVRSSRKCSPVFACMVMIKSWHRDGGVDPVSFCTLMTAVDGDDWLICGCDDRRIR
jgi:hypothetical protein